MTAPLSMPGTRPSCNLRPTVRHGGGIIDVVSGHPEHKVRQHPVLDGPSMLAVAMSLLLTPLLTAALDRIAGIGQNGLAGAGQPCSDDAT